MTKLERADVVRLFAMFATDYGQKWTSRFRGEDQVKVGINGWFAKLEHLTREEIAYGYRRVGQSFKQWPPSVYEFIDLCRHPDPLHHHWLLPVEPEGSDRGGPGYRAFRAYMRSVGHEPTTPDPDDDVEMSPA